MDILYISVEPFILFFPVNKTLEERRTVRDGRGNEETTVTRSGGHDGGQDGPYRHTGPALPGLYARRHTKCPVQ